MIEPPIAGSGVCTAMGKGHPPALIMLTDSHETHGGHGLRMPAGVV